eukprot:g1499.t1
MKGWKLSAEENMRALSERRKFEMLTAAAAAGAAISKRNVKKMNQSTQTEEAKEKEKSRNCSSPKLNFESTDEVHWAQKIARRIASADFDRAVARAKADTSAKLNRLADRLRLEASKMLQSEVLHREVIGKKERKIPKWMKENQSNSPKRQKKSKQQNSNVPSSSKMNVYKYINKYAKKERKPTLHHVIDKYAKSRRQKKKTHVKNGNVCEKMKPKGSASTNRSVGVTPALRQRRATKGLVDWQKNLRNYDAKSSTLECDKEEKREESEVVEGEKSAPEEIIDTLPTKSLKKTSIPLPKTGYKENIRTALNTRVPIVSSTVNLENEIQYTKYCEALLRKPLN